MIDWGSIKSYEESYRKFKWELPEQYNIADQVCDNWANEDPHAIAIKEYEDINIGRCISIGEVQTRANVLANHLKELDIRRGDRVGVIRSQNAWTAAAHIAIWKLGAVSVPLSKLFGQDALAYRVEDADLVAIICEGDMENKLKTFPIHIIKPELLSRQKLTFQNETTKPDDPAVIIYTSGTTGKSKGVLHGHRVLAGHLPGVILSHNGLGRPDDCIWTPADWAWIGGLFVVLMPGLALRIPVVAARMNKFEPIFAEKLIEVAKVKNVFFPPTALRMLKAENSSLGQLRSIGTGGEPLGQEIVNWINQNFTSSINEHYGQSECNIAVSNCSSLIDLKEGTIGKPVFGYEVEVLDSLGKPTLGVGEIAIKRGAASMMIKYWNKPEETKKKYKGNWMLTGDIGLWEGGHLKFAGRDDDIISSAGYRIGPGEIEDCILKHSLVANVGVVGKPDKLRTEIVKAYVVMKKGFTGDNRVAAEIQEIVRKDLSKYAFPREIEFIAELPLTVTGKVIRKELRDKARAEVVGKD